VFEKRILTVGVLAWLTLLAAGRLQAEEPAVVDSDSPPDCNCCAGQECCLPPPRPTWYVDTEGIALKRTVLDRIDIASLGTMPGHLMVLDRDDLDQPFQAGPRILIGHTFEGSPIQIEFSYFGLEDWDATTGVRSDSGNLYTRFTGFGNPPFAGLDNSNSIQIHEHSHLDDEEFNWKRAICLPTNCMAVTFLIGARHMSIREQFDYFSQVTTGATAGDSAAVHAQTANDLWGPQVGGTVEFYTSQQSWIRLDGKAALCDNFASRDLQSAIVGGTTASVPASALSGSGTTYVGDIGVTVYWRPTEHIISRIGYQAIWVHDLALAAENFDIDPVSGQPPVAMNRRGSSLYQGPFAGIELNW
jgi:hypothetical protein